MGEVTGGQAQQPADFFSTSSHFPLSSCSPSQTGCLPFSAGRPRAWHHTCSGGSSHRQPSTPFTCPQEKPWLIKHQSHSQGAPAAGCTAGSCAAWQPRALLPPTPDKSIAFLQHPSPGKCLTFTVVCFPINNTPTPLVYFLKHLV